MSSVDSAPLSATKKALLAIRDLKKEIATLKAHKNEPIAIVSMAFRLPGGIDTPERYWDLLTKGKHALTTMPLDRWDVEAYFSNNPSALGKMYVSQGGFINDVAGFDASLFDLDEDEALSMDPQQRIMLELCWEAFERAAMHPLSAAPPSNDIATFIGHAAGGYARYALYSGDPKRIDQHSVTGSAPSFVAGRISYTYGLQGPALTVDTACSSSLVALHLACQSLRLGECSSALAGGVNLLLSPEEYIYFCKTAALSPNATCRAFDADADGYVRSEGAGVFVLKRLSDAVKENLPVLAVIRGSAINHDGETNGITSPSGPSQIKLIQSAIANSELTANDIQYVETHGTGTPLGDPIEINSLGAVLAGDKSQDEELCLIGSCKTNLGHLEAAAGIASVAKVIISLQEKKIPPSINFKTPNPYIDWNRWPLKVANENCAWPVTHKNKVATAGVSGFGFSGSNAHLIIQEAKASSASNMVQTQLPVVILLSSHNRKKYAEFIEELSAYIKDNRPEPSQEPAFLASLSRVLMSGRAQGKIRMAAVVKSLGQLEELLHAILNEKNHENIIKQGDLASESALIPDFSERLIETCFSWVNNKRVDWQEFISNYSKEYTSLPLYNFSHKRYWPEDVAYEASYIKRTTSDDSDAPRTENTVISDDILIDSVINLKQFVASNLKLPNSTVEDSRSLHELGVGSIDLVKLRFSLEQHLGASIPIQNLIGDITWDSFYEELKRIQPTDVDVLACKRTIEDQPHELMEGSNSNRTFQLNPLQEAYWVGRQIGDKQTRVGSHIYIEIEIEPIDISTLEFALNKLIARHELMRCKITSKGEMDVLTDVSPFEISTHKLDTGNRFKIAEHFAAVRARMSHKIYEVNTWPLFNVECSSIGARHYIHFDIDEIICDGASLNILLRDWQSIVKGDFVDEPLTFTYFDYQKYMQARLTPEAISGDIDYWRNRIIQCGGLLPGGPELPTREVPLSGKRVRFKGMLQESQWKKLQQKATELHVSPTTLVITLFSAMLRGSDTPSSFIVTYFNRLPVHENMDSNVGPFASTGLFIANESLTTPLPEVCQNYQAQLWQNSEHASLDGVSLLRELRRLKLWDPKQPISVVFTSMLENFEGVVSSGNCWATDWSYSVTQTPQVLLDHQLGVIRDRMFYSWDVAVEILDGEKIENLFRRYQQLLGEFVDGPSLDLPSLLAYRGVELPQQVLNPTNVQQAYLFGRYSEGSNCKVYQEFLISDVSAETVEDVINLLCKRHDMLRASYDKNGKIVIPAIRPSIKIDTHEFESQNDVAFVKLQNDLIASSANPSVWPLFSITHSRFKEVSPNKICLHVVIDMLIADWPSMQIFYKELFEMLINGKPDYYHNYGVFGEYLKNTELVNQTKSKDSLAYWENKLKQIPEAKLLKNTSTASGGIVRLHAEILEWSQIREKYNAKEADVQHAFLTAYGGALKSLVASDSEFPVVVVDFKRRTLPENTGAGLEYHKAIGDFTYLSWVKFSGQQAEFSQYVHEVTEQVEADFDRWPCSGIPALRNHGPYARSGNALAMPFVFSRLLELPSVEMPSSVDQGLGVSITPGVLVDNVSFSQNETLHIHWDVDTSKISLSVIKTVFDGYVNAIRELS